MDKTDLILKCEDSSRKSLTITISYVNPNIADATLKTLAEALIALTTNSLKKTTKETESVL